MDCRNLLPFCSMGLLERIQSVIHFLAELWSNSEVQIPSIEPAKQLWQMGNVGKYELWFPLLYCTSWNSSAI